jgi:tetratricopeptide (TPR) repeat protein
MSYEAFISYSHATDGQFAPILQRSLQRFAKPWWKLWALRIFRDETNLAAAPDLTDSIKKALEASHFFILLASRAGARSKWVGRELSFWLASKPPENILIVLTDGTIVWGDAGDFDWSNTDALPQALAGSFRSEPLWVDLTWARRAEQLSPREARFQQAVAQLAAPLHGKSLDEIAGEEVRQHRKTRRLVQMVIAAIALLAAAAATAAWFAHQGRLRAERNLEQALVAVNDIETAVAKDLQDLAGIPVGLRMKMLRGVEGVLTNLATSGEAAAVRGKRGVMLSEFATAYGVLGYYPDAISRIREAVVLFSDQLKSHPADAAMRGALAKSHKVYGDVLWWQRKDLPGAIEELRTSADSYATLVSSFVDYKEADADDWKLFEFRALIGIGDVYFDGSVNPSSVCSERSSCLDEAHMYFNRAQQVATSAQPQDDSDFHWRNALLVSRERIAKVDEAHDDVRQASRTYSELLEEYKRMHEAQPNNAKWEENLMALHWRVGGIEMKACRPSAALDSFSAALEIAHLLNDSEPGRIDWSRELSLSLKYAAEAEDALGRTDAAGKDYGASLRIVRYLSDKQPADAGLKTDIHEIEAALSHLGTAGPRCAN